MERELKIDCYEGSVYKVEFCPNFLDEKEATILFKELREKPWVNPQKHRRGVQSYGDDGINSYTFEMYGKKIERKILKWPESLFAVKKRVETFTNDVAARSPATVIL